MLTLAILDVVLTVLLLGANVVVMFLLWSHLKVMEQVAHKLELWAEPAQMASPGLPPGTTWAPSDAELAVLEQRYTKDSRQRVTAQGGLKPSRRILNRTAG